MPTKCCWVIHGSVTSERKAFTSQSSFINHALDPAARSSAQAPSSSSLHVHVHALRSSSARQAQNASTRSPPVGSTRSRGNVMQDLDSVDQWATASATTFNAMKSSVMLFAGKRGRKCSSVMVLGQATVEQSERTQHLGVILTTALSWTPHVDNLIRRVSCKVYMVKRLVYRCGSNAFVRHLYISLVRPVLEYARPVWDSCTLENCLRIERLQLSVARAILRASRRTKPNVSVLGDIGWPTLAWRRRRYELLLFWKLLNRQGPLSLQSKLPPLASKRATQTLRKNTFRQAVCKTSRRLLAFLPSCIALWNSLPVSCTSCSSPHTFLAS